MSMPVFRKSVLLPAELERVFLFHRDPGNLDKVQPPGAEVVESDFPDILEKGSVCSLIVKVPLGVQKWKIQVDEMSMSDDGRHAVMVDRALQSPFAYWVHRHQFERSEEGTLMCDEVCFKAPGGIFSWLLAGPAYLLLQVLFTFRHYKTVKYFSSSAGEQS